MSTPMSWSDRGTYRPVETDHRKAALSIRQPWAWLIVHGHKDVENRTWETSFRGRLLIHASGRFTQREYEEAEAVVLGIMGGSFRLPSYEDLRRQCGGVVGEATLVDCVRQSSSRWFTGPFGFVLESPQVVPFAPAKGRLGIHEQPVEDCV